MSEPANTSCAAETFVRELNALQKAYYAQPPEARTQRIKEAEAFRQRQNDSLIKKLLAESRAPLRQWQHTNLVRDGEWADAERKIVAKLGTGYLLALVGNRGCGKTQLAVEAMRVRVHKGQRTRYCTATEFFMEVKAAYSHETRSEKDVLNEFAKPSLLVMDEIGQRSESEWENRLLFELLNRRYNTLKDTLLISNQSVEEFSKSIGLSLISRMIETGGLIECKWSSYRKAA